MTETDNDPIAGSCDYSPSPLPQSGSGQMINLHDNVTLKLLIFILSKRRMLAFQAWNAYKKGVGPVLRTPTRRTRRVIRAPTCYAVFAYIMFTPPPGASRTGAFVLLTSGTKPGEPSKGASAAPRR